MALGAADDAPQAPAMVEAAALPPRPYVIHVGRFSAQKRHDVLLDAFARLDAPHRLVLLAERGALHAFHDGVGIGEGRPDPLRGGGDVHAFGEMEHVSARDLKAGSRIYSAVANIGDRRDFEK